MGRPAKKGLDYFPRDVDFWDDFKIMDLLNTYGPLGTAVYDVILTTVYRNGYYLEVPLEKMAAQVIRVIGNRWITDKNFVLEIIRYCGEIGLFNNDLLPQSVITSVGIQRRYAEVTARNKADKSKYWLLEEPAPAVDTVIPSEEISASETEVNASAIPQSKGKKRKENKKKEEERKVCYPPIPCKDGSYLLSEKEYDELTHTYPDMQIDLSLQKLTDYLTANPDKQRNRQYMTGYMRMWLCNDNESGKYRKKKTSSLYAPTYDLEEFEHSSVVDEEEWFENAERI